MDKKEDIVVVEKNIGSRKKSLRAVAVLLAAASGINFGCGIKSSSKSTINQMEIDKVLDTDTNIILNDVSETPQIEVTPSPEPILTEEIIEEEKEEVHTSFFASALEYKIIYSKPSAKSDKLSILAEGEALPLVKDLGNGWYSIEYDEGEAYITSDSVEVFEGIEAPKQAIIPNINSAEEIFQYVNVNSRIVRATAKVNVREKATTDSKKLGQLSKGDTLPFVKEHESWYEVEYNGKKAFVFKEYAQIDNSYTINNEVYDRVFATRKTPIIDPISGEVLTYIPKHEVAEVYAKTNDMYLVRYDGNIGYMSRKHACTLGDYYVIIDISDQNLKAYKDDILFEDTPIVTGQATGKKKSPTYCGVFAVKEKKQNVYWKEFKVKVKYWMPFNRGEGMHDASWRKKFGGKIYLKNGSHGCVNIKPSVMPKIYKNIKVGSIVLVKK